ncbi:MAG: CoA ester lyase [Thiothrix sp.]|nr:CoA ester lyase [Thiothrix sp.]HPE60187.1 CoA ester lyase [Thiolinea sp.]
MVTAPLPHTRTPLFVPANRPERFAKAAASGADGIILDLEDAVAADARDAARMALRRDFTPLPVMVRINAAHTRWHAADLAAVRQLLPAAVMLPKAEQPDVVAGVVAALGGQIPVLALIETAGGLAQARAIAALPGVEQLVFGSVDFCADLGCEHQREVLLPARFELVLASRLAGIAAPLDGVTTRLDDPAIVQADARHARDLGMGGKLCIHPRQIAAVQNAFAPSAAEVDWARRVLASGDGAVAVDGAMVDEPVRQRARAILAAQPQTRP